MAVWSWLEGKGRAEVKDDAWAFGRWIFGNWSQEYVFLPGKSHGQRSLVGCSSWGHKESDWACMYHHTTQWHESILDKAGPSQVMVPIRLPLHQARLAFPQTPASPAPTTEETVIFLRWSACLLRAVWTPSFTLNVLLVWLAAHWMVSWCFHICCLVSPFPF